MLQYSTIRFTYVWWANCQKINAFSALGWLIDNSTTSNEYWGHIILIPLAINSILYISARSSYKRPPSNGDSIYIWRQSHDNYSFQYLPLHTTLSICLPSSQIYHPSPSSHPHYWQKPSLNDSLLYHLQAPLYQDTLSILHHLTTNTNPQ